MTFVLGIDPGSTGAFAVYDSSTRRVVGDIMDVPVWYQTVGKRKRKRVDPLTLSDMFDTYVLMGVELIVMEAVGGRKGQNTAHAFTFGYGVGIIYMAAFYSGIPIESVPPQTWKQVLRVPGKSKADESAIMSRADELFPKDRGKFRGVKGGKRLDRAEAAMIAKFGGDEILRSVSPLLTEQEIRDRLRLADTGA